MKIYLVGGAVRDKLLHLPVKERDYVVVGATIDDMLQAGYKQVGKEFPVFLHPTTREEYALARMERKFKPGYKGFTVDTSPDVTLEADLQRRDLTINAMAEAPDGKLIDPYHGKQDLERKLLRHVSPAFAEDPVRILRVGRFLARYAHLGFHVAPETVALMQQMVKAGEVDALVAERVWKELERALTEKNPEKFFAVLADCHALPILFPQLTATGPGIQALQHAAALPTVRFAALLYAQPEIENTDSPQQTIMKLCNRYRVPTAYRELAVLTALHYKTALAAKSCTPEELLQLFNTADIYRREQRFNDFLRTCSAIAQSLHQPFEADWLHACAKAAKSVDVQALIKAGAEGAVLAQQLREKRRDKIADYCRQS